ncbi:hypothetical protein [Nonomuraea roseoviolacea]|uniref:DNA-binding transcriptional ArsR family regulator n=1 Tax=Nonomuraea roseoviolacea subsp. carminata TaxID=160689 RepID=A0ABT1K7M3_9ACTN|nr:hypothetical protein [Nonomuraea roseoviolacea]MCP2349994.1 DNA-binding transcriptional ArsR family regulator [Nonomuraea roseoviolacea subsp. carminata]
MPAHRRETSGAEEVSTVSHHVTVLRQCGIVSTRIDGTARPSRLRRDDLERRFPGLLASVLPAGPRVRSC